MDMVHGIELEHVWSDMGIEDKFAVVRAIAGFQKAWTSISFKKFGSLYYAGDLEQSVKNEVLYFDTDGAGIVNSRFAIGPCTGREYFDDGRGTVEFDRGPCTICLLEKRIMSRLTQNQGRVQKTTRQR